MPGKPERGEGRSFARQAREIKKQSPENYPGTALIFWWRLGDSNPTSEKPRKPLEILDYSNAAFLFCTYILY